MKKLLPIALLMICYSFIGFGQISDADIEQTWVFQGDLNGGPNPAGLDTLTFPSSLGRFSSTSFGDLDGDGDMDFVAGSRNGKIFYYENSGTVTDPNFGLSHAIPTIDTIQFPIYGTNETRPELADIDNDGDLDLFVGPRNDYNRYVQFKLNDIHYFENIGSATNPVFQYSTLPGIENQQTAEFTGIALVDLDGDNDLDMYVAGSDSCSMLWNTGTISAPNFVRQYGHDPASPFYGWSETSYLAPVPDFEDFDNDGDLDLYFGSEAGLTRYIENVGTATAPDFGDLLSHPAHAPLDVEGFGNFLTVEFVDITGDGVKDAFMGSFTPGSFAWYKGEPKCGGSNSSIPTAAGTYTSTNTSIAGDWVNYCDDNDNLLLSLKIGTSGAVVADNEVSLKIESPTTTYHLQDCGTTPACFIDLADGAVVFQRLWDVDPTTQPSSGNVGVKFYFTQAEYDAVNTELANQSQTQLTGMDQMWFYKVTNSGLGQFPTIPTITANDVLTIGNHASTPATDQWVLSTRTAGSEFIAEYEVSSFSGGGGGGAASGSRPLPIELIFFHAYADAGHAKLKWATAAETNNRGFEVQRSRNGGDWEKLGFVDGEGTTSLQTNYHFTDTQPFSGNNYYRLKQMDWDNHIEYLPVQVVNMKDGEQAPVQVYPNPAKTFLNITHVKGQGMVYNASGQLLKTINLTADGINTINVSQLEKGVYQLVIIQEDGERVVKRFLK